MTSLRRLENWLRPSRLPFRGVMALGLLLGLLATGVASYWEYHQITRFHQARFQRQADTALAFARDSLERHVLLLHGLGALFRASDSVERADFRAYALAMGLEHHFPGVRAIGYLPLVRGGEVARLEARARGEGVPEYVVRPSPGAGAEQVAPVWYVEPFSGANTRMPGRDFLAEPILAAAMAQARGSGQVSLSGPVKLVAEWGEAQPAALVLFYPVYDPGMLRFTQAQREAAILGYCFAVLRVGDVLAGVGEALGVDLELYDGRIAPAYLLFDTDRHRMTHAAPRPRFAEHQITQTLAQRDWTWYLGTLPAFEAEMDYSPVLFTGSGGLAGTVLVLALIASLGLGRQRAERLARAMTERLRRQNDALNRSMREARHQQSVLDAHAIVSITDPQGDILYVNRLFCENSGYSAEELLGQNHRLLKSGRHEAAFYERMWATIARGEIWHGEVCNRAKDGREHWLDTTIVPILDARGAPERYVSARTDITALKQAQEALRQHRDRLHEEVAARTREAVKAKEQAEAASLAKSEFLANMSHELRTPMHAVLSYSELGEAKMGRADFTPEKVRSYFQRIHQSGHRLLGLINDLLDLSKMEAGRMRYDPRPTALPPLLRRVGDNLSALLAARGLRLELGGCAEEVEALFDPARMEQVCVNLLSNAIRFSPEGGVIRVACEPATLPGRRAGDAPVPGLRVSVGDQGPGIPEAELERVFDKFVQVNHGKQGAGGTGLGLAICREILQAHRGRIWAENQAGGGARFVFEFPLQPPAA